jgi:hypothetical protein
MTQPQVRAKKSGIIKKCPEIRAKTTKAVLLPQRPSNRSKSKLLEPPNARLDHKQCPIGWLKPGANPAGSRGAVFCRSRGRLITFVIVRRASGPVCYPDSSSHHSKGDGICGAPECFSTQARFTSSIGAASSSVMRFLASRALADDPDPSRISDPYGAVRLYHE